jgi:hypothetical protein
MDRISTRVFRGCRTGSFVYNLYSLAKLDVSKLKAFLLGTRSDEGTGYLRCEERQRRISSGR